MKLKDLITEVSRDDYGAKSVENTIIVNLINLEIFFVDDLANQLRKT